MSKRLDKEREAKIQPIRMRVAIEKLTEMGVYVEQVNETQVTFLFNGHPIHFFPYSGWHTGKSIKDGRGLHNLLKQLK